jgi:predicted ATPase
MTVLIGRARERVALRDVLEQHRARRLVTLTGPGGIGKTRLALAVAADLASSFREGARLVDLAPVDHADLVLLAIAAAVDVADSTDEPLVEALCKAPRARDLLLVVDNFKHVIDAASALDRLVRSCPRLTVLVTSRRPLHLDDERELEVPRSRKTRPSHSSCTARKPPESTSR